MIKSILQSDVVLMILTPRYKDKADNLHGGVGYEYNIINGELFKIIEQNDKYIPVLRQGTLESSATLFLQGFYCLDLRDGANYKNNLKELFDKILKVPIKEPAQNASNKPVMAEDYKELETLTHEMTSNASQYFKNLYILSNKSLTKSNLKIKIDSWEMEIEKCSNSIKEDFNPKKIALYEEYLESFQHDVFGKKLWTVSSALDTRDPDLARYKKDFREAEAQEIYNTVKRILTKTHEYVSKTAKNISYSESLTVSDLNFKYLDSDEMFMNRIIGYGIRSEILHRYYPTFFPIMTQRPGESSTSVKRVSSSLERKSL